MQNVGNDFDVIGVNYTFHSPTAQSFREIMCIHMPFDSDPSLSLVSIHIQYAICMLL